MNKYVSDHHPVREPREPIIMGGESAIPSDGCLRDCINFQMESIKKSESDIRRYIEKCFKDAFEAEARVYEPNAWSLEYVVVRNSSGRWQFIPLIFWCKYARVFRRVERSLRNNFEKRFGLIYGKTDELRYIIYSDSRDFSVSIQIDPNYTEAFFKVKERNRFVGVTLSIFDLSYDEMPKGECMPAARYEKLLFNYWGIDAGMYIPMDENDDRRHLPDLITYNWDNYWNLYKRTFGEDPGAKYDIVCSSGVERIYGREDNTNETPRTGTRES